jgi:hypothetical protein
MEAVRSYILLGFLALPLVIIVLIAFLGFSLASPGMLVLLLGHLLVVPTSVYGLHFLFRKVSPDSPLLFSGPKDIPQLVPSETISDGSSICIAPSFWMAHVVFFMSYIIINAAYLLSAPKRSGTSPVLYENRKSKLTSVIIITSILLLAITGLRFYITGAETVIGILTAFTFMGALSFGWYHALRAMFNYKDIDIFGIVGQLQPPAAGSEKPVTCVYDVNLTG